MYSANKIRATSTIKIQNIYRASINDTISNRALFFLLILFWSKNSIVAYILGFLRGLPYIGKFVDIIYFFVLAILIMMSLEEVLANVSINNIIFCLAFVFIVLAGFIFSDNFQYIKMYLPDMFFKIIPAFLLGLSFNANRSIKVFGKRRYLFDILYFLSVIGICLAVLYFFYYTAFTHRVTGTDLGQWSTNMIPNAIICICYAIREKKISSWLFVTISFIMLTAYGTRMGLVCFTIAVLCYYLIYTKKLKIIIWALISISLILYISSNLELILIWLKQTFSQYGFSTRIIDFVLIKEVHAEARVDYFSRCLEWIGERPLIGYGVFGDRVLLGGYQEYAHNLFLELWVQFGIFFGFIIATSFIGIIVSGLIHSWNNNNQRDLIVGLCSYIMVNLMFSGSYLVDRFFWLLIGICIASARTKYFCQ